MGVAAGAVPRPVDPSPNASASAARVLVRSTRDVLDDAGEAARRCLTPQERHRASLLRRAGDRDDFVAAHHLVRVVAAVLTGGEPEYLVVRQACDRCTRAHGRPYLPEHPGTHVSWAHTRGVVAAAASPYAVGVDVERIDGSAISHAVARAVLSDDELQQGRRGAGQPLSWLRGWVRKEALVKVGLLTLDTARSLDLSCLPLSESRAPQPVGRGGLHLTDLTLPHLGSVAAVAVADSAGVTVA